MNLISPYVLPGLPRTHVAITPDFIIDTVLERLQLQRHQLASRSRKVELVTARQLCWRYLRTLLGLNLADCAIKTGTAYDHTTVIYGVKTIADRIDTEDRLRRLDLHFMEVFNSVLRNAEPIKTAAHEEHYQ